MVLVAELSTKHQQPRRHRLGTKPLPKGQLIIRTFKRLNHRIVTPTRIDTHIAPARDTHTLAVVWIVPLVAVIIGGWLIYKASSEKGLTINITFNSAEGLEAGKTKIKYKDVELGQVEHITLSPNLSQVVVSAQLDKEAGKHLSENSSFWVVRARIAVGGISDLGTIFSGAYIEVDFGEPGKRTLHFKGLEEPPIVTTGLPGRHFILEADRRGSLDIGSAVYYRQIKVGQIVAYQLAPDGRMITFKIFVHAPYHNYVRKNTHFWNASGLDVSLDAKGIRIDTESLATLIVGGIAFDVPKNTRPGDPSGRTGCLRTPPNRWCS